MVGTPYGRDCAFYGQPNSEFAGLGSDELDKKRFTLADIAPEQRRNSSTNTILATAGSADCSGKSAAAGSRFQTRHLSGWRKCVSAG